MRGVSWSLDKRRVSAPKLNRNPGGRLGCRHERVEATRGSWWSASGQAQVCENFGNHGGIFNGRDEGQGAAALQTGGHVDREDSFE